MSFKKKFFIFILIIALIIIFYFAFYFTFKNYLLPRFLKIVGINKIEKIEITPFFIFKRIVLLKGEGEFFDFEKAEIELSFSSLFLRQLTFNKINLEKLVFKFKEERKTIKEETKEKKLIAFSLPFFLKAIEIKELNLIGGDFKKEPLTLKDLQLNLFLSLQEGVLKGELKTFSGSFSYKSVLYQFSLEKTDFLLSEEKFSVFIAPLKVKNSLFTGSILYHLKNNEWQIKIDSALVFLKDFIAFRDTVDGEGILTGDLTIKNNNYYGKAQLYFKKVKIKDKALNDLKLAFNFLDKKVNYQLSGKIFNANFKSEGSFSLKDFSYELILEILELKELLPFEIKKGYLKLSGEKLTALRFDFNLELEKERLEYVAGKGFYKNKKIWLENLTGGSKKQEVYFSFTGELEKEKIILKGEFNKFPIALLAFFIKKEPTGFLNGKAEITYSPKKLLVIKGDLAIKDFLLTKDLSLNYLRFSGNFSFFKKIEFDGEIWAQNLKTPAFTFDSFALRSFNNNFSFTTFFKEKNFLKIDGLLLNNSLDSLVFSLETLLFVFNGNKFSNQKVLLGQLIKKDFWQLKDFALKSQETEINLEIEKEKEILKVAGEIKNFPLENIFLFLEKKEKLSGKSDFHFDGKYDLFKKNLVNLLLITKINNFRFKEITFDSVKGNFILEKESLKVKILSLFKKSAESKITGFLLFDWAKRELIDQNLFLVLKNLPTEIIFFIPDILTPKEGKINGELNLTGNLKDFQMTGMAKLSDCEVILKIPETRIKNLSGTISFSQRNIYLLNLWGKAKEGEVLADGLITLGDFFKVETLFKKVKFKNLPLTYGKDFMGIVSGNVLLGLNKKNYLKIIGDGEIKEALITLPFGRKEEADKKSLDTLLELDLTFKGERNIWLRNKNADLELGVDFNLKLKKGQFTYSGEIKTRQGDLYYLGRRLQLKEGEIVFENIPYFDPKLSLTGFLLTKPLKWNNKRERFKIILKIDGYLSSPNFSLSSEAPHLSEEEMISYLGLSFTWEELKNWEERSLFLDVLQERLLSYFEKEASEKLRKYIGLSYLRLESSFWEKPYLRLEVGKYLGEKFYFSYTHTFLETTKDIFRTEYFLKENQRLIGERNEQGKTVIKYLFYFQF